MDLPQAAIGPGMAVFSRYRAVIEPDGSPMTVRSALALINEVLDEVLAEQEGDFDADTRFAIAWFASTATTRAVRRRGQPRPRAATPSVDGTGPGRGPDQPGRQGRAASARRPARRL